MLAQTGQVLDILHHSGNVHDSRGSVDFVESCVKVVRAISPRVRIEARMDGAFFGEEMVRKLDTLGVEYPISVPFERFAKLKEMVERRKRWDRVPEQRRERSAFEKSWKPQCWKRKGRFLFVRTERPKQRKGPLQLDLFEPVGLGYDY